MNTLTKTEARVAGSIMEKVEARRQVNAVLTRLAARIEANKELRAAKEAEGEALRQGVLPELTPSAKRLIESL